MFLFSCNSDDHQSAAESLYQMLVSVLTVLPPLFLFSRLFIPLGVFISYNNSYYYYSWFYST